MKILICAESFYPEINGVSSVLTNLTRELSKKNITINVATKKISQNYLILNGDTIFKADMASIYEKFLSDINKKPIHNEDDQCLYVSIGNLPLDDTISAL